MWLGGRDWGAKSGREKVRRVDRWPRTRKPRRAGLFGVRRRGLEPPPGYPGPGPQPGASTNSAIGARAGASIALRGSSFESVQRGRYIYEHMFAPLDQPAVTAI